MRALIVAMLLSFSLYAAVVVSRLKRSREELWESEEKYRRIIDTAEEGVCILDREDKISFVNRKFAEMFGYTMEEMTGRPLLSLADGDGRAPVEASLARHHGGERERGDFRLKRSDGSDIWLSVSAAPLFKNGEYEGSLAMVNDITERKKAEQVIAERLDELERFRKATVQRELRIKELKDRPGAR
ncbi:MAG: PAS domain S-box protein [Deltaproteobacteria bacterium]|nr:PAS domain S-box protein [Deltaproteobacteria bacterium]